MAMIVSEMDTWGPLTSDAPAIMFNLIALHANLMTPNNSLETIAFAKALRNIGAKLQANTAFTRSTTLLSLRIRPEHFHHEATLTRLTLFVAIELAHIVQGDIVVAEQTAMEYKVLATNQGGEGESGEGLGKEPEYPFGVLSATFAFETVHAVHVVGFVVAAVEEEVCGVEPFVCVE